MDALGNVAYWEKVTEDGYAVIESKNVIAGFAFNGGYKAASLSVYGSVDGVEWTLIETVTVKTSYADYQFAVASSAGYKYLKLDAVGNQVRIPSITLETIA